MTLTSTQTRIIERPFAGDADFWKVRTLLQETFPITPVGWNWEIRRWEGKFFHDTEPKPTDYWSRRIHLWETEAGRLVGVVNPEGDGNVFLQLHPDFRHLEDQMFAWAEANMPAEEPRALETFAFNYDAPRQRILTERGWEKQTYGGVTRRMRLGAWELPPVQMAAGYTLRTTQPGEDAARIAAILNAAFGRDFHMPADVASFFAQAPCFRHDLDLAAVAPDGSFAAYVGVIFDDANHFGLFEPVCTHPDHRRKGLARALMVEGLHRLKALGVVYVHVDTGDQIPANRLYDAVGFTEVYKGHVWRKTF